MGEVVINAEGDTHGAHTEKGEGPLTVVNIYRPEPTGRQAESVFLRTLLSSKSRQGKMNKTNVPPARRIK